MNILAIECSAGPVSAAVISDGKTVGSSFSDIKLTHSQTLFPIMENVLSSVKLNFTDIDAIAVATGPGSFTGLRIGIASAKGLAEPKNLICVGASTLLCAAYMFLGEDAVICPVIDARCNQVYNALIRVKGDTVNRLCEDRAILIDDLASELQDAGGKIILCGDATDAVFDAVKGCANIVKAPVSLRLPNAVGVGLYAAKAIENGDYTTAGELMPIYLKLPQAERELKQKKGENV